MPQTLLSPSSHPPKASGDAPSGDMEWPSLSGSAPASGWVFSLVPVPLFLWAIVLWAPGTSNTSKYPKLDTQEPVSMCLESLGVNSG